MFYILVFTSPLVIPVLLAALLGERITPKKALTLLVGFCDVVIAVAPWSHAQCVDLIGLGSCQCTSPAFRSTWSGRACLRAPNRQRALPSAPVW
jgi:drug/metabolite transporter (DMT)-like permease